jgi:hypothetical protein
MATNRVGSQGSGHTYAGREHVLLEKAALLADKLLPVFDSPSGLPYYAIRTSGPAPAYQSEDPKSYRYCAPQFILA